MYSTHKFSDTSWVISELICIIFGLVVPTLDVWFSKVKKKNIFIVSIVVLLMILYESIAIWPHVLQKFQTAHSDQVEDRTDNIII